MKEIRISMVISNCENETEDTMWHKFMDLVEENGWKAGGSVIDITNETDEN